MSPKTIIPDPEEEPKGRGNLVVSRSLHLPLSAKHSDEVSPVLLTTFSSLVAVNLTCNLVGCFAAFDKKFHLLRRHVMSRKRIDLDMPRQPIWIVLSLRFYVRLDNAHLL